MNRLARVSGEILKELEERKVKTQQELYKVKYEVSRRYGLEFVPRNLHVFLAASSAQRKRFSGLLVTKPVRTISGVAPVAVFSKPMACPPQAQCVFCPGGPGSVFGDVPKSYTGNEPASRRAARNKYDPYLQVFNRLEQYALLNQDFGKVEVIVMGGTFCYYPKVYRDGFVRDVYRAVNDFGELFFVEGVFDDERFKEFFELPCENIHDVRRIERIHEKLLNKKKNLVLSFEGEQGRNERAAIRVVSFLVETRPDLGKLREANEVLSYGGTKVELGVQSVFDEDLEFVKRGHNVQESVESMRILKDVGLKLNTHYMLGLSKDSVKDARGLKMLLEDERFKPDMLKVYPCLVMPGTPLFEMWKRGEYTPLSVEEVVRILVDMKRGVPPWVRIQRIQRDIPSTVIAGGPVKTNLRQLVQEQCREEGVRCACIRCREPMSKSVDWASVEFVQREYNASKGKEVFLSVEDVKNDLILGFCRVRFPSQELREEITSSTALVRELHVYGSAANLGKKGSVQHHGYGQELMKRAEEVAREHGKDKMVVIAGVGVREYYEKKLGYARDGPYMSKKV